MWSFWETVEMQHRYVIACAVWCVLMRIVGCSVIIWEHAAESSDTAC